MDIAEYLAKNNHKLNFPKNFLHFLIGATLFISTGANSDYLKILLGILGVTIAYQSVYCLNDILDYSEDSKNELKRMLKPVARGEVSRETMAAKMFLYAVVGMAISFSVGNFFGLLVALALFLNFFHSYNPGGMKKSPIGLVNLFFIEFIKFSCGWFIMAESLANFPFFIFFMMALIYSVFYVSYKDEINVSSLKKKRAVFFTALAIISYALSFYLYGGFRFFMLIFLVSTLPFYFATRANDAFSRLKTGVIIAFAFLILVNAANFLVLFEPFHSMSLYLASLL